MFYLIYYVIQFLKYFGVLHWRKSMNICVLKNIILSTLRDALAYFYVTEKLFRGT